MADPSRPQGASRPQGHSTPPPAQALGGRPRSGRSRASASSYFCSCSVLRRTRNSSGRALSSLLGALAEDDHGRIWDLAGERVKQQVRRDYGRIRSPDYESWRWSEFWRHTGLTRSRVERMSLEGILRGSSSRALRAGPLRLACRGEDRPPEGRGDEGLHRWTECMGRRPVRSRESGVASTSRVRAETGHFTDPEGFVWYVPRPQVRKVSAFLPRNPVSPDDIDLVLEIGPGEYERDQIEGLALKIDAVLEKGPRGSESPPRGLSRSALETGRPRPLRRPPRGREGVPVRRGGEGTHASRHPAERGACGGPRPGHSIPGPLTTARRPPDHRTLAKVAWARGYRAGTP